MSLWLAARKRIAPTFRRYPTLKRWLVQQEDRLESTRHTIARHLPTLIQPRTRNITIAITADCNLRCVGCRYGRDFMAGQQLSLAMIRDLLDDAAEMKVQTVRFYGGEPLLHRDLPAMVEHAIHCGLEPYVTTNATILDRKIDDLYAAGLRFLTIGYYGTGADYDSYVHRRKAYQRLENGIASVRERYGSSVHMRLNWLLMRPSCNLDSLHEVWEFASKYDMPIQVDLVHYSLPYFTEGPDRQLQFQAEDRPVIMQIVNELLRLRSENPAMFDGSEMGLRSIPDWLLKGPRMRIPCDKYDMIWVGADGTVQLCYVTFKLGNLHQQRLHTMANGAPHCKAAQSAFKLDCPNCHCGYDSRIRKHAFSRRQYGRPLA